MFELPPPAEFGPIDWWAAAGWGLAGAVAMLAATWVTRQRTR